MLLIINGPTIDAKNWNQPTPVERRNMDARKRQRKARALDAILSNARNRPVSFWAKLRTWLYFGKWC